MRKGIVILVLTSDFTTLIVARRRIIRIRLTRDIGSETRNYPIFFGPTKQSNRPNISPFCFNVSCLNLTFKFGSYTLFRCWSGSHLWAMEPSKAVSSYPEISDPDLWNARYKELRGRGQHQWATSEREERGRIFQYDVWTHAHVLRTKPKS